MIARPVLFTKRRNFVATTFFFFILQVGLVLLSDSQNGISAGRGAVGKVPVFGLLKRNGKVYAAMIPNAKSETLMPIIRDKVTPDSIVYTDCWRGYNALDVSEFKHYRINHSELFADKHNHINGIENFWNQAKRHLRKFNGVPRSHFHLFLKECEWRFNNSDPKSQLKQLNQWVREYMG